MSISLRDRKVQDLSEVQNPYRFKVNVLIAEKDTTIEMLDPN